MDCEWQPIETAPRDDTPVLLFGTRWKFDWHGAEDVGFSAVCSFNYGEWRVLHTVYYETVCITPTHWMPLPEPPGEV